MNELTYKHCPVCGIHYAAPTAFFNARNNGQSADNQGWYCPNGHYLVFSDSALAKAERERDRLRQQIAQKIDELLLANRREADAKREAARVRKRALAALCPCCNRHFVQLARHMKSKHPEIATLPNKARA